MAMAMQVAMLTRWEWFKLRRRWVPWILLAFVLVIVQLLFWLVAVFGDDVSYQSTAENIANGLGFSSFFGPFIAVILASAVLGGEYGWGTLRSVLVKGVGRWQFLASKVSVVVLFTAALLIILCITVTISGFIAEAILTAPETTEPYEDISAVDLLAFYGRMLYAFVPYIGLALFFAVATTSNGVTVGLSVAYYVAENFLLVPIIGNFGWSDQVFTYLLGTNVSAWLDIDDQTIPSIATFGGISDMAHGFIIVTVYTAVLTGAAIALFLRRDIAGAKGG